MSEEAKVCHVDEATMGDKSVETLCHTGVLLNVGFPVSRICLFPVQH